MAVAVKFDKPQNSGGSLLNITADKFWEETLRPMLDDASDGMTDVELSRTARKIMNSVDTKLYDKHFSTQDIIDELIPALNVLSSDTYYITGPLKKATEAEKDKVRGIKEAINNFRVILKMDEKPAEEKQADVKERLNYKPSNDGKLNGNNADFLEHNMAKLNEPSPRPRIPNDTF